MSEQGTLMNFVGGQWQRSGTSRFANVVNPATAQALTTVPLSPTAEVDVAVQAAAKAFPDWRHMPTGDHIQYLFKFKMLLEEHLDELARTITDECGREIYAESVGEIR